MKVDFSNAKVDDIVYSIHYGEGEVALIDLHGDILIQFNGSSREKLYFYNNGNYNKSDLFPTIYPYPVEITRVKQKVRKYKALFIDYEDQPVVSSTYYFSKEEFESKNCTYGKEFLQLLESLFIEVEE